MSAGLLTIQAVGENDPISQAIRYFSIEGDVSHIDIEMPNGSLLGARIHGGVRERPQGYAKFSVIRRMQVEVPNIEASYTFARAQRGKLYNWMALVNMGLRRKRRFTMNQERWFCDELAYAVAMAGGLRLLNTTNPLNLTPYELTLSPLWTNLPSKDHA